MFFTVESILHDHELGFVQDVSSIVSFSTAALSHSLHPLECTMTAAKAQKHDSGDTQYELKLSKMRYIILVRNCGNDPSVSPF